jgi:hypothetical protein
MIVDDKTLLRWKTLKKQGTITDIKNASGISRVTLTLAFLHGIASEQTIQIINNHFKSLQDDEHRESKRKKHLF